MLKILHLDADLVAIDKPAGLLVHPSRLDAHERETALAALEGQLGEKLFPLHRLDKATSGVLLFARSAEAARHFAAAFEATEKRYLALVRGWPPESGTIDHPLARDPEKPSAGQPHREALTRFQRLACHEWPFRVDERHATTRTALVEAQPVTGRRHQVRLHLKHIAHPIVGDSTHGKGPLNRAAAAYFGAQRLWLHALAVRLPGGLRIEAAPGAEWERFFDSQ
ncbi:pseudouridine synthase [Ramlibacter albus]|uniref:tRNA pseudouridine synthase C n=1 Tax=Ramlibacter albus TaxID=2079448 RepID=A0A923M931_9BURK|nr:pseudouridine synthase [Ramlibacter albus]MBC5765625.1 pseudouridine synthase [Ramlibacter albus]